MLHGDCVARATSPGVSATDASEHLRHPLPGLQKCQGKAVAATCTAPHQDDVESPPK